MPAQLNDLYTANVNTMKRVTELSLRVWDRFNQQQLNLLRTYSECGQRQLGLWSGGNGAQRPTEFFAVEADIAKRLSRQVLDSSRIMLATAQDVACAAMNCAEELLGSLSRPEDKSGAETEVQQKVVHHKRPAAPV